MLMMRFNVGVWWKSLYPVIQLAADPLAVLAMIGEMAGDTTLNARVPLVEAVI